MNVNDWVADVARLWTNPIVSKVWRPRLRKLTFTRCLHIIMHTCQPQLQSVCHSPSGCGCHGRVAGQALASERAACNACKLPRRFGFTLLELMIALGLLGALMSVAWSLMATFQDAEQRGWKMTQRTQIIRAAHDWLQSDAHQVITQSPEMSFTGSSLGFTTLIAPSLDPLPFLERLMSDSTASDDYDLLGTSSTSTPTSSSTGLGGAAGLLSEPEMAEILGDNSPWNKARLEIEYQLLPMPTADTSISAIPQPPTGNLPAEDIQFMLVRRELVSGAVAGQSGSSLDDAQSIPASERVLTGQDLYRQTDDEQLTSSGIAIVESRLEGLVRPQFQYSDGRAWTSSWNSRSAGGLPVAVALRFDFPARSQMQPRPPRMPSDPLDDPSDLGLADVSTVSAADMALAAEPQAELETEPDASLMESEEFEVQMVILLYRQPKAAARSAGSLGGSFADGSFDYDAEFPLGNPAQSMPTDTLPRAEFSAPSGQTGRSSSGSRQTEQGNREQRDGF